MTAAAAVFQNGPEGLQLFPGGKFFGGGEDGADGFRILTVAGSQSLKLFPGCFLCTEGVQLVILICPPWPEFPSGW